MVLCRWDINVSSSDGLETYSNDNHRKLEDELLMISSLGLVVWPRFYVSMDCEQKAIH